jgi:hypothetical protein
MQRQKTRKKSNDATSDATIGTIDADVLEDVYEKATNMIGVTSVAYRSNQVEQKSTSDGCT